MRSIGLFIIIFFCSCSAELPDEQQLTDEFYQQHLKALKKKIYNRCRDDQIAKANIKVDSIVHRLLNADLHDTLNFPARPMKPTRPENIIGTVKKFEVEAKEE